MAIRFCAMMVQRSGVCRFVLALWSLSGSLEVGGCRAIRPRSFTDLVVDLKGSGGVELTWRRWSRAAGDLTMKITLLRRGLPPVLHQIAQVPSFNTTKRSHLSRARVFNRLL
jgi:hypothetical protein